MNNSTYLTLALAMCLGIFAAPSLADVPAVPKQPLAQKPTQTKTDRYEAQANYHKAMAEHYR